MDAETLDRLEAATGDVHNHPTPDAAYECKSGLDPCWPETFRQMLPLARRGLSAPDAPRGDGPHAEICQSHFDEDCDCRGLAAPDAPLREALTKRVIPALTAAYALIEQTDYNAPAFEDEVVSPAHAAIEALLYGDDRLDLLLAAPDAPRDGLDVERLEAAMARVDARIAEEYPDEAAILADDPGRHDFAVALAAEYNAAAPDAPRDAYPPEPITDGAGHDHNPEACAACRRIADLFFDSGMRTAARGLAAPRDGLDVVFTAYADALDEACTAAMLDREDGDELPDWLVALEDMAESLRLSAKRYARLAQPEVTTIPDALVRDAIDATIGLHDHPTPDAAYECESGIDPCLAQPEATPEEPGR